MELLATVTAIGVLYVAWQQWQTNKDRLRLELFDKRFAIYDATRTFLANVITDGKVKEEKWRAFRLATREAEWLFGSSVYRFIEKEICSRVLDYQRLTSELEGSFPEETRDEDRREIIAQRNEISTFMKKSFDELPCRFKPYLDITKPL